MRIVKEHLNGVISTRVVKNDKVIGYMNYGNGSSRLSTILETIPDLKFTKSIEIDDA